MFYLIGLLMIVSASILLLGLASRRSQRDIEPRDDASRERLAAARDLH
jgi:hypothetical protein